MKKIITLGLALICMFFIAFPCYAQSNDSAVQEQLDEMTNEIQRGMENAVDGDVNEILQENDISVKNSEGISKISVGSVINSVLSSFTGVLKKPLVMLGKIIAITLLCVTAKSMAPGGSSVTSTFGIIGILSAIAVMYDTVYASFEIISQSLQKLSDFMTSYIPIFSSVVAVGGNITSSGSYYAVTFILCEIIGIVANKVIMPFLSIVLAISLVSAINPELQFSGAADSIKKASQWILAGLMTIFVGLLSIQGLTGSAADTLTSRTLKFAASSFIPVIGGAVSEAYSTVCSSMGVIRTGVGSIGIIVISVMVLKPIISIIAIKFIISLAQIISGMFGQKECCEFLKSTNAVLSIGMSVVICFSLIFIIATAVLMLTAMNIAI